MSQAYIFSARAQEQAVHPRDADPAGMFGHIARVLLRRVKKCVFVRVYAYPLIYRQTDRQTKRQTDKQTNRQTDRQTNRQKDKQTDRQTDKQTRRQTDRPTDGRTDGRTERDVYTRIDIHVYIYTYIYTRPISLSYNQNPINTQKKTRIYKSSSSRLQVIQGAAGASWSARSAPGRSSEAETSGFWGLKLFFFWVVRV